MARLPRFLIVGQPQHVIIRGNNRQAIFRATADYAFYLEKLKAAFEKHRFDLHAYVLMTNHVHLLITPWGEDSIPKAVQMLGRYYVQYFNYRYRRTGTLWEGRYKAALIDSEHYLLACMRYIELNPVRAAMVASPSDYPWSSYRFNALGESSSLVAPHCVYQRLGSSPLERQSAYRELFLVQLTEGILAELRDSVNKAWVLGGDRFKEQIAGQAGRRVEPAARGGDRKSKLFLGADKS